MPWKRYSGRLTQHHILQLFRSGAYQLDGQVVIGKRGTPITVNTSGRYSEYKCVRLYGFGRYINIPVHKLVWMVNRGIPIPKGFDVHHVDEDPSNNAFENLVLVFSLDHPKLHASADNEVPF